MKVWFLPKSSIERVRIMQCKRKIAGGLRAHAALIYFDFNQIHREIVDDQSFMLLPLPFEFVHEVSQLTVMLLVIFQLLHFQLKLSVALHTERDVSLQMWYHLPTFSPAEILLTTIGRLHALFSWFVVGRYFRLLFGSWLERWALRWWVVWCRIDRFGLADMLFGLPLAWTAECVHLEVPLTHGLGDDVHLSLGSDLCLLLHSYYHCFRFFQRLRIWLAPYFLLFPQPLAVLLNTTVGCICLYFRLLCLKGDQFAFYLIEFELELIEGVCLGRVFSPFQLCV